MKLKKRITTGVLLSASVLALVGCTTGTIEDSVAKFDGIDSGKIEVAFEVDSDTYGVYGMNITGQFEYVGEDTEENKAQAKASGKVLKVNATELEEEDGEELSVTATSEDLDLTDEEKASLEEFEAELISGEGEEDGEDVALEEKDPSRDYNYQIVEENRVLIDGQETKSSGEIIALGDKLYDKVFLTGSEADGRFIYDSRDVGIVEYPISDFVKVSPIIEAFNLEGNDIEVSYGDLHNGEKGHVFTVSPEQAVSSLQEVNDSNLTQNILGLVTEANVDKVIVGVNENSFSVQAISTGATDGDENPTSESDKKEDAKVGEESVIGSLVITKTSEKVEIEEPTNALDLDEFSSLVELFYQEQAEKHLESQISEDELYLDGEVVGEVVEELEQEDTDATTEQEETTLEEEDTEPEVEDESSEEE